MPVPVCVNVKKLTRNVVVKDEVHNYCNLINELIGINCYIQDLRVLIHKYKLLLSKGRLKEYVIAGCEMLAFYFRDVYNKPEVKGNLTYPLSTDDSIKHYML